MATCRPAACSSLSHPHAAFIASSIQQAMKAGDVRGWEQGLPPPNSDTTACTKVNLADPLIASDNVCKCYNVRHKEADICYSCSTVPGIYGSKQTKSEGRTRE